MPSSLILFGGTFDPIHNGHLALAAKLYEQFHQPITFMPTAFPPYKTLPQATPQQRLEMLHLALQGDQRFILDPSEINQTNYSPTYNTLISLRNKYGYQLPIFFLIGGDSLVTLDSWDSWRQLFDLTNFIVAMRPGYEVKHMLPELYAEFEARKTTDFTKLSPYGQFYLLDFIPMDISSTKIRLMVKTHQLLSGLVPVLVEKYIQQNNLYLN
jgi:nicotinate-nucleotide adenylyltransferase